MNLQDQIMSKRAFYRLGLKPSTVHFRSYDCRKWVPKAPTCHLWQWLAVGTHKLQWRRPETEWVFFGEFVVRCLELKVASRCTHELASAYGELKDDGSGEQRLVVAHKGSACWGSSFFVQIDDGSVEELQLKSMLAWGSCRCDEEATEGQANSRFAHLVRTSRDSFAAFPSKPCIDEDRGRSEWADRRMGWSDRAWNVRIRGGRWVDREKRWGWGEKRKKKKGKERERKKERKKERKRKIVRVFGFFKTRIYTLLEFLKQGFVFM